MLGLMRARLPLVAALALVLLAGCGGDAPYALDPSADCVAGDGTAVERWAGTDTPTQGARPPAGGVLRATFDDGQTAWAAFGEDAEDAEEMAAELDAADALPGTFAEIMRPVVETQRNAVVYGFFPEGDELTAGFTAALDTVEGCLREG